MSGLADDINLRKVFVLYATTRTLDQFFDADQLLVCFDPEHLGLGDYIGKQVVPHAMSEFNGCSFPFDMLDSRGFLKGYVEAQPGDYMLLLRSSNCVASIIKYAYDRLVATDFRNSELRKEIKELESGIVDERWIDRHREILKSITRGLEQ